MNKITTVQDIGHLVREERKRQGVTQDDLAGLANVSTHFVINLERGKPETATAKTAGLDLVLVLQIVSALGLDLSLSRRSVRKLPLP